MKKKAKEYLKEFNSGTKTMFKEFFNKDTNTKQRANMWTFSRLIIPILTAIFSTLAIISGLYPLFVTAGIIAGIGGITDWFDGRSARKHECSSKYGKLLDQVTDKFFAGIIGINLLFLNINYIIFLLGEAMIAGVNLYYNKKYDMDIDSNLIGKIKQLPLFLTLTLGYFAPINNTLLTISNISILVTFAFQLASASKYLENNKKEAQQIKRNKFYNELLEEIEDKEHEKAKNLEVQKSINNNKTNNPTISKIDEYIQLRNLLNNNLQADNNIEEKTDSKQNIKKK